MDSKERAIKLVIQAYQELYQAGISEEFLDILTSIAQKNVGTFFGSFGSDNGCFVEFQKSGNKLVPIKFSFGVRRYRNLFFSRMWQAIKEGWAILCGFQVPLPQGDGIAQPTKSEEPFLFC